MLVRFLVRLSSNVDLLQFINTKGSGSHFYLKNNRELSFFPQQVGLCIIIFFHLPLAVLNKLTLLGLG